jgi:hypothetical protein
MRKPWFQIISSDTALNNFACEGGRRQFDSTRWGDASAQLKDEPVAVCGHMRVVAVTTFI